MVIRHPGSSVGSESCADLSHKSQDEGPLAFARWRPIMGLLSWLFGGDGGKGRDIGELARRLDMPPESLLAIRPVYSTFRIPKRSGGTRVISAPAPELKRVQRLILGRVLARLATHRSATGFERGKSIVSNAAAHAGAALIIRMDIKDFFGTTRADRLLGYFRTIGWNREASELLTLLCTHEDALPQGAPTSPRLANLVNRELDIRLERAALAHGAIYTRYADDITFSVLEDANDREARSIRPILGITRLVVEEYGYQLNWKKSPRVMRGHHRQVVTGLVVNGGMPRLSRETRRWLRAVEHRAATGDRATLTEAELKGWRAYRDMVERGTQGEL